MHPRCAPRWPAVLMLALALANLRLGLAAELPSTPLSAAERPDGRLAPAIGAPRDSVLWRYETGG